MHLFEWPVMSILSAEQTREIKQLLLSRKAELEELLSNVEDGAKPVSLDQPIGRLSRMDALQQQSMSQANRMDAAIRLEQFKAALNRIGTEDFGCCVECDEEIDYARLQARPEAPFCIDCQGSRERRG